MKLGDQAAAWIEGKLDEFPIELEGEGVLTPAKRYGELAMVAALVLDRGEDARARRWLDLAWAHFESGAALARGIETMPANVSIYPAFRRHGFRTAELDRVSMAVWDRIEDPTLRLLLACSAANTEIAAPQSIDQLLAESVLERQPATWLVDERTAYVLTHIVLFLAPTNALPERYRAFLVRSVPVWISRFAAAGFLDLVGELIMIAHLLGECVPAVEWNVLIDAQEPDGLVPFRAAWRGRDVAPRMRFLANYHSTLTAYAAAAIASR